jgi:RHS repeat-associated protein
MPGTSRGGSKLRSRGKSFLAGAIADERMRQERLELGLGKDRQRRLPRFSLGIAVLALFMLAPSAASATELPKTITENTTLTPAGNPYTGNSTVESGVTLTIEPGVKLTLGSLNVKGTLKAEGTAEKPVVFTGAKEEKGGEWTNIVFKPGSGESVLDHVEVAYGGSTAPLGAAGTVEVLGGSSPKITNSTFRHDAATSIYVFEGGAPEIANNEISDCYTAKEKAGRGIYYYASSKQTGEVNIHGNSVARCKAGITVYTLLSSVTGKTLGSNTVAETEEKALSFEGGDIPGDVTGNTLSGNKENVIWVSGTVNHSETWSNGGSQVRFGGEVTVAAEATLTITEGVYLMNPKMRVKGTLKAEGTAKEPIIFTGAKGLPGEWSSITFEPGSGESLLDHVEVAYGGGVGIFDPQGTIVSKGSSPKITNSTFRHNEVTSIYVTEGGAPEIANNEISDCYSTSNKGISYSAGSKQTGEVNIHGNTVVRCATGITVDTTLSSVTGKTLGSNTVTETEKKALSFEGPEIPGDITGNTLSANKENVIWVKGEVGHSETWNNGGSKVEFSGEVRVAAKATLTITKGVFMTNPSFVILGTLKAEGTAKEPVIFTGAKEEKAGEWPSITFESGSGESVLEHVEVAYGGGVGGFNPQGTVVSKHSPLKIVNSTFHDNKGTSILINEGGAPEIANNAIVNCATSGKAISYDAGSGQTGEVNIHGNYVAGCSTGIKVDTRTSKVTGKTLGSNTITGSEEKALSFEGFEIPDEVTNNTLSANKENVISVSGNVNHSETWSNGGALVKFSSTTTIASGATLTIGQGVVMTNPNMTVKGTLKANGTAEKPIVFTGAKEEKAGEWENLKFEAGSGESTLEQVEVAYGGSSGGMIEIKGSHPLITNTTIRKSKNYGVKVTESGSPTIQWNRFRSNANGLSYSGTSKLSAPNNDWGCASGPSPAGCGDSVTSNVDWKPAIQLPELAGHCRGKESQCGEGADPVSLATGRLNYSHRDLLLTNKSAVPLEFARAYYSGSSSDTGLGPGWSQSGLASATELESGEVLVVRPDGRQDVFQKTESGYKAPSGVTDTLAKVEGTFRLTTLQNTVYAFDASGRIASITDDHGLKTTYAYNAEGRLATITDPSAQTLTFTYNASNHITLVKDSTGREVKFAYSAAGDLESVTDALGGVTKYAYDSSHRLTSITDPRGNVILKNVYNGEGKITEQEDGLKDLWKLKYSPGETVVTEPQGGKLAYGFDAQNRVVSETDQLGHTTTTAYDAAGNVSEVIQPGGGKWAFGHDATGNLTSVKDPEGGERKYEYDGLNRLTSFTDARGDTWKYEWSKANDLTKVTDPEGGETTYTYSESGQPLTLTDPDKHKSEFSYDSRGNRLSVTDPLGHKASFEYNSRNYLTSKTLPGLKAESFEPDALGDILAHTTPEGHKTKYAYDANGLPTQITDPGEGVWKIEYNAMERPTTYTDPLEQQTKVSYNGNLRPTKVLNKRGKETTYGYDAANQITEVDRPEGEDWAYGYDSRGNRSSVIEPRGNETTYEYDALNRMTKASEPLGVTTKYGYDANGDLTSVTDPRGNATSYAFDKLGRLTEVKQPLEKTTKYGYDAVGNQLTKTTAAGTLEYGYDAANRLTEVKSGESALRSFGYDAANRRTSATDVEGRKIEIAYNEDSLVSSINDGRGQALTRSYNSRGLLTKQEDGRGTIEYGYDKLGRATSLTDPQGKALGFAYDPEGDLTEVKRPSGATTTNVFNDAGRLAETTSKDESSTVLEALKYGYDKAGNVTSRLDARLEAETTYTYDALDRLTEFNPPGEGATAYGYDKAGNRTEAGATTYEYNALDQLTKASDGTAYGYDGAGRMTAKESEAGKTTYEWDLFDHLTKAEGPSGTASYAYDGLGRLSERKGEAGTQIVHYGDLTDRATYDADGEGKTTVSYLAGPRGLLEERSAEATSYPLADAHGDLTAITGPTGGVESRQSYDPWGTQLSGPTLEYGWLGAQQRRADPTTGLIQMGARSYDPALGSFASQDPVLGHIGIGVSANRYPYAWNNPLSRYDLTGRDALPAMPICILGCSPSEPHEIAERAEDFVKSVGNTISHIHIHIGGGNRECEKRFIASTSPFFPCEEEEGSLEFEENPPTYVPPVDPMGPHPSPGSLIPVPAPTEPEPVFP